MLAFSFSVEVIAWPVLPLNLLWFGICASRRARFPSSGIGMELLAFFLRSVAVGALLSPAIVGNRYIAFPVPSLWVLSSYFYYSRPTTPDEVSSIDFAASSLRWCVGLSFLIHFLVGCIRIKRLRRCEER